MNTLERECCVLGYHIYAHIWEAAVGEVLDCRLEPDNAIDVYSISHELANTTLTPRYVAHVQK